MEVATAEALDQLIRELEDQIMAVQHLDVPGTKLLLNMARLDLLTKRHNINEDELEALCAAVERTIYMGNHARRAAQPSRRTGSRPRRTSDRNVVLKLVQRR